MQNIIVNESIQNYNQNIPIMTKFWTVKIALIENNRKELHNPHFLRKINFVRGKNSLTWFKFHLKERTTGHR